MNLDPGDFPRLIYLILLLAMVLFWYMRGRRRNAGRGLKHMLIWVLIFAMVIIAYGFRDTLKRELFPGTPLPAGQDAVELRRGPDGHFHARTEVNGVSVEFIVDTGASSIVLSQADARRAGIDLSSLDFSGRANTANGLVSTAPVTLGTLRFGDLTASRVPAQVNGGDMAGSLLGMTWLDRFSKVEIEGSRMRLEY